MQIFVHPPLNTLTTVNSSSINFRVYFVYSNEQADISEAEIWTNIHGSEWHGIKLNQPAGTSLEHTFLDLAHIEASCICQFSLDMKTADLPYEFEFTVRWRTHTQDDWQWIGSVGSNARVVVYKPLAPATASVFFWQQQLKSIIKPFSASGNIADSWHATASSASCLLKARSSHSEPFCQLTSIQRYLAFVRKDQFWIIPQTGESAIGTGNFDVVCLLVEAASGVYAALVPFVQGSSVSHAAVLKVQANVVHIQSTLPNIDSMRIAMGLALDPHGAIEESMLRVQQSLSPISSQSNRMLPPASAHPCSLLYHRGYCTWNGFYQSISHDSLISQLNRLQDDGLPFDWVLIDDGWQAVDRNDQHGRLYDIFADQLKFPGQLKQTTSLLFDMGVCRVGVWHALWGYWSGIDPEGTLAKRYELVKCRQRSMEIKGEAEVWLITASSIYKFYNDFYHWLAGQGVSFVKVDYQAAFECIELYGDKSAEDSCIAVAEMYSAYYNAMEQAAMRHFGPGSIIYCMAQSPYLITRTLQRLGQPVDAKCPVDRTTDMLFRNSDDYFPDVAASHGWHIYCNMANSAWSRCLSGYFAIDWDMFQPGSPESQIHAASRQISGGPVYLTGKAADISAERKHLGTNIVLPHPPPLLDKSCLFSDMTTTPSLLVSTVTLDSIVVVAAFNLYSTALVAPIQLHELYSTAVEHSGKPHSTHQQPKYLATYQKSTSRLRVLPTNTLSFAVALKPLTCDTWTVSPMLLTKCSGHKAVLYSAFLGDTSKYVGVMAIERNVHSVLSNSLRASKSNDGQYQWNIRARVAATADKATFAFVAYEAAASNSSKLLLDISNIRLSNMDGNFTDWQFDHETGKLELELPQQASFITITICSDIPMASIVPC
ncbi:glycoside hydrolase superfamily [Coemansia mojavensis]|nr:glycoside hydrolase superfamily [Coemansia mojavensis]